MEYTIETLQIKKIKQEFKNEKDYIQPHNWTS